ncbi:MAG: acyl-CoA dehydrogenase [Alphaproteobacteria bacterium]|nr:acyl-CoA dehydrogenase [Alphaproteobacteria bacterium]
MQAFNLDLCELPPQAAALREDVRAFLADSLAEFPPAGRARSWVGFDGEFSRKLGAQGWLGMTWPEPYGRARSALERYVVIEELLAAGAPVAAHWIGERQSGPLILRFGTEDQQQRLLPAIAAGESYFCIGMSEPDSGSDLASIRTRGVCGDGGWVINGQKVWTTYAHKSHYMIALVRTGEAGDDRHAGFSQFIVDLSTPGVTVRPIRNMIGDEEFNEVIFEDVFIPDDMLVGEEGNGWQQVIAELAFERSGPDRFLSSFQLIVEMVRRACVIEGETQSGGKKTVISTRASIAIGRLTAHLITLRQMSLAVAAQLDAGVQPVVEATVVKDLGVAFEQSIPEIAHDLFGVSPRLDSGDDFEKALAYVQQANVSFSLRGGTTEILRGVIARGLGLR